MSECAKENIEKSFVGLQGHFSANGIDDRIINLQRRPKMMEERARQMEEAEERA